MQRNQRSSCQHLLDHGKSESSRKKYAVLNMPKPLAVWITKKSVENSSRYGNTSPPYLPPEKSVCRSRSNS